LYVGAAASAAEVAVQVARLKVAFPKQPELFFNILAERIVAHRFTARRLEDAVNSVVDSFRYKELNVSDVIGYDRRAKLYTANEFMRAQMEGERPDEFEKRVVSGRAYWVKKSDM
jgi:hypothetical protein